MRSKKRIFLITALLYILYTIFPLFADTFNNIPVWLPSMAAVAIMVGLFPKAFANKTFYWFLVYAMVLVVYLLFGRPLTIGIGKMADSKKIIIEFAFILPSISIFCILYHLKDELLTRQLVNWSIGILFVSFIIALPLMQQYGSIRAALHEEGKDIFVPGLPGYSLMHAYTLIVPVLCYAVKANKGRKKRLSFVGLAVLCFMVYETFVATSLILMLAVLLFSLIYNDKNKVVMWIVVVILGMVIWLLYESGFFISLIDWMMPAFEDTPVAFKLNDFRQSMLEGQITGASITDRMDYHDISIHSFLQNPIFGTSRVGSHSSLLDRLGGMGLVVGLPFIMIFVSFALQVRKQYDTTMARTFFMVGIIIGLVFLYNKGNWGCESWLLYFILMPMTIGTIEKSNLMKSNNNETA